MNISLAMENPSPTFHLWGEEVTSVISQKFVISLQEKLSRLQISHFDRTQNKVFTCPNKQHWEGSCPAENIMWGGEQAAPLVAALWSFNVTVNVVSAAVDDLQLLDHHYVNLFSFSLEMKESVINLE